MKHINNPLPAPGFTLAKLAALPDEWRQVLKSPSGTGYKRDLRADVIKQREALAYAQACYHDTRRGSL